MIAGTGAAKTNEANATAQLTHACAESAFFKGSKCAAGALFTLDLSVLETGK